MIIDDSLLLSAGRRSLLSRRALGMPLRTPTRLLHPPVTRKCHYLSSVFNERPAKNSCFGSRSMHTFGTVLEISLPRGVFFYLTQFFLYSFYLLFNSWNLIRFNNAKQINQTIHEKNLINTCVPIYKLFVLLWTGFSRLVSRTYADTHASDSDYRKIQCSVYVISVFRVDASRNSAGCRAPLNDIAVFNPLINDAWCFW